MIRDENIFLSHGGESKSSSRKLVDVGVLGMLDVSPFLVVMLLANPD
jgi:hypothetical protein